MTAQTKKTQRLMDVEIDKIEVVDNVRLDLRDIDELAGSIKRRGILQALLVTPSEDGERIELLIGHRRLAAAKIAGLTKVPCILRPREGDAARVLDQLTENIHRDELTAIEKAHALKVLRDEGMTHGEIAVRVHRSDQWVKNMLHLLTLPPEVQRAVHLGWITSTRAIDIPQDFLNAPGASDRLEAFIRNQGKNGLQLWYQAEYERRSQASLAAAGRALAPGKKMTDPEAIAQLERLEELERRKQRERDAENRAFNDAAHALIALHKDEFELLREAHFKEYMESVA